jgi:cytochrome c peroxidase
MHGNGRNSSLWLGACTLIAVAVAGCGPATDAAFCGEFGCELDSSTWERLQALANLGEPPPDRSNRYVGNAAAITLGQKFYFDARFSGASTQLDMLRRTTQYARTAAGQPANVSCATCHNPARAGGDFTSIPGHVSVGAGWYDVNGQQTVNAAFYELIYWNGRSDSLWSQIMAVNESFVSMNSTRLKNTWLIKEKYLAEYNAVFTTKPFPTEMSGTSAEATALANGTGDKEHQCALVAGACPAPCREVANTTGGTSCWPRFPAQGKGGSKTGCQGGDATEPFRDAWDCMAATDKDLVTQVFVNFAKAIAAYEYVLVSGNSAFDQFVNGDSSAISEEAKRGAALFVGKASCSECHSTAFFSDNAFHNIGVQQVGAAVPTVTDCTEGSACDCVAGNNCLPWGGWDGLKKLQANAGWTDSRNTSRNGKWSDDPTDYSRKTKWIDVGLNADLKGAWRTPSLRDVALTAPYMHNGVYRTLEEVVWHYNMGGASAGFPGEKSVRIKPLMLTKQEESDLVAFLHTLTGEPLPKSLTTAPTLP